MNIKTDSFLKTGTTHVHCQDYVFNKSIKDMNTNEEYYQIVLSDGCSGGENAELGSRILCNIMHKNKFTDNDLLLEEIMKNYHKFNESFSNKEFFNLSSMFATLLDVLLYNNFIKIKIRGDGGYFIDFTDGTKELSSIEFESGAPYYPLYNAYKTKHVDYLRNFGSSPIFLSKKI